MACSGYGRRAKSTFIIVNALAKRLAAPATAGAVVTALAFGHRDIIGALLYLPHFWLGADWLKELELVQLRPLKTLAALMIIFINPCPLTIWLQ